MVAKPQIFLSTMFSLQKLSLIASIISLVNAGTAPTLPNFNLIWSDTFEGDAGTAPSTDNWVHRTGAQSNNEVETYTTTTDNCALSGDGSLVITPLLSETGEWTSCRIETNSEFTCAEGEMMVIQALIKLGSTSGIGGHAGIWPAFWALGASMRSGTEWPQCGEWDIMENVNAQSLGYGTLHCADVCDGTNGLGAAIGFDYSAYHTWAFAVDLTNSDWTQQQMRWYLDGQLYHTITGANIGTESEWTDLTSKPYFLILNVAVGGNWPGNPNADTVDGAASSMQVQYVGVYTSA